jgi:endonuclease G, mitochondrial
MGFCMNYQGVVAGNFPRTSLQNAAPQRSPLNQGKQLWQRLENYILNSAHARIQSLRRHRSVYTDEDPVLEEESVRVTMKFWKVVVMEDSERNKLRAAAYWFSPEQLIRKLLKIATASRRRPPPVM